MIDIFILLEYPTRFSYTYFMINYSGHLKTLSLFAVATVVAVVNTKKSKNP